MNAADIHLLQKEGTAALVMPSKLTGMLATGRPVIATAYPGTQVADQVFGRGIPVAPGDRDALHEAVLSLAANADLRKRDGCREQVLQRFEAEMEGLFHTKRELAIPPSTQPEAHSPSPE